MEKLASCAVHGDMCKVVVAAVRSTTNEGDAKAITSELLARNDMHMKSLGLLAARQTPWLEAILQFLNSASTLSIQATRFAVELANTPANIDQIISAGLQLKAPASKRRFFKQVVASGNSDLARALHEALVRKDAVCNAFLPPQKLLHLLPAEQLLAAVQSNPDTLYGLHWKYLARQQPQAAVACMRLALESSPKGDSRRLGRMWQLITPAVREMLERREGLEDVLLLVIEFPLPGTAFPLPLERLKKLMLPPLKAVDSGRGAAAVDLFMSVLRRLPGQTLEALDLSYLIKKRRTLKALKSVEGALEEFAATKASDVSCLARYLRGFHSMSLRNCLLDSTASKTQNFEDRLQQDFLRTCCFPAVLGVVSPRLRDRFVKRLQERLEGEDTELAAIRRKQLLYHRYFPDVADDLRKLCRRSEAAERANALRRLLVAASESRVAPGVLKEALEFVATRIQNEQQPVVEAALSGIAHLHPWQIMLEHTAVLEKLAEDADTADDARGYGTPSEPIASLVASVGRWRLRSLPCADLEADALLQWTVNFSLRSWKEHGQFCGGGPDRVVEELHSLGADKCHLLLEKLLPVIERWQEEGDSNAAAAAAAMALIAGLREHGWGNQRLQELVDWALYTELGYLKPDRHPVLSYDLNQAIQGPPQLLERRVAQLFKYNLEIFRLNRAQKAEDSGREVPAASPRIWEYSGGNRDRKQTLATNFSVCIEGGELKCDLLEDMMRSSSLVDLLLDACEEFSCVPGMPTRKAALFVRRLWPKQKHRLAALAWRVWSNICARAGKEDLADHLEQCNGGSPIEIARLLPALLAATGEASMNDLARFQADAPQDLQLMAQFGVLRAFPRLVDWQGALQRLADWALRDAATTSLLQGRTRGPSLGSCLAWAGRTSEPQEMLSTFKRLLQEDALPLTLRKQILRTLVLLPSKEGNEYLDEVISGFQSLHRDLKIAVLIACLSSPSNLLWRVLPLCAADPEEEVACKALSKLRYMCGRVGPPRHAASYLSAVMQTRNHPAVKVRNMLWGSLSSLAGTLELRLFDMLLTAASETVLDISQKEAWRGAAQMLVASASATRGGLRCVTDIAASLAARCNTKEEAESCWEKRDAPHRQRLLVLCSSLAGGQGAHHSYGYGRYRARTLLQHCLSVKRAGYEHYYEDSESDEDSLPVAGQGSAGSSLTREALVEFASSWESAHPKLVRQHWNVFCQMRVTAAALGPDQTVEARVEAAEALIQLANDAREESEAIQKLKGQVWGWVNRQAEALPIAEALAQKSSAGCRGLAALILHLAIQKDRRLGGIDGAALQLLRQLRKDADESVSRRAWSSFCYQEI